MSTGTHTNTNYSIKDAARLTGLSESTLRYYESIGLLDPIGRGVTSKQREYNDQDINLAISVACLSNTGMSIQNMRAYLANRFGGKTSAVDQIQLLQTQKAKLIDEAYHLNLRQRYVDTKIAYWNAVISDDSAAITLILKTADQVAKELNQSHS